LFYGTPKKPEERSRTGTYTHIPFSNLNPFRFKRGFAFTHSIQIPLASYTQGSEKGNVVLVYYLIETVTPYLF
jgi:hypothetical protein